MGYSEEFFDDLERCQNIFDIAACLYDYILNMVDNETILMSAYMDDVPKSMAGEKNPNHSALEKLTNEIIILFQNAPEEVYFHNNLAQIQDIFQSFGLKAFKKMNYNEASVLLAVLNGIDYYIEQELDEGKYAGMKGGPLNSQPQECAAAVYMKSPRSLLAEIEKNWGYRKKTESSTIKDKLRALTFIRRSEWIRNVPYPRVVFLPISRNGRKKVKKQVEGHRISIAVFPFSVKRDFDFVGVAGSTFRINYNEDSFERLTENIRIMMDEAISRNVNFIVLPEFSISNILLDGIKAYLKSSDNREMIFKSGLIAVFAGTTWENTDDNVLHILDYTGEELGKYYKYSPFTMEDSNEEGNFEMCEGLQNPGAECTVLDISKIGRVLPAICRDIIDGDYTEKLVKTLLPFMVVAPAYSSSVTSFEPHFIKYADSFHVCSVLCNYCGAVETKREQVGMVSVPGKKKSRMKAGLKSVCRENECTEKCGSEVEGCGFLVELDFSAVGKNGRIKQPVIECSQFLWKK